MRRITDDDTITDNHIYCRIDVDDIPPSVLKQIAEAAYIEGWQDGAAQIASDASKWDAILDFEHPAHTPMSMKPDQLFHVVYNYLGRCVGYYYDTAEDYDNEEAHGNAD